MRYVILAFFLMLFCTAPFSDASDNRASLPDCTLSVSFDIPHSTIRGSSKIAVEGDQELSFDISRLSVVDVMFNGKTIPFSSNRGIISIRTGKSGLLEIFYEGSFVPPRTGHNANGMSGIVDNIISEQGIFLTGIWYPQPQRMMSCRLAAILPAGYEAVSEAERIDSLTKHGKRQFTFFFDHPIEHLNFIASNRFRVLKERSGDIDLYAYFFDEDIGLAKEYLEHAKGYFDLYSKMLTPYPYRRFSIVENILPTGYSMPTFTLLGQDVVKLPFIVRTSLGHEILHQWFGNSVYIDYEKGNWAEGLTTYLADHLYAEQKGEGADYRKQILLDYQSYVNKGNVFPLRQFRGRTDFSSRAIGYGKAAMLFHMLKEELGSDRFNQALRNFILKNVYTKASWNDLKASFEAVSGSKLTDFFDQWLDRTDIPDLNAGSAAVRQKGEGYQVSFDLRQNSKPFDVTVPVAIYAGGKKESVPVKINENLNDLTLYSRELPDRIVIDENYDVMRVLSSAEFPPVIARILGDINPILVLPSSGNAYDKVIETFGSRGAVIKKASDIDESLQGNASFIVLGADNPVLERFGAPVKPIKGGFTVDVRPNPLNPGRVIAVIDAQSREEADAASGKIFHYGKYSRLAFDKGKNILKEIAPSNRGMTVEMKAEAAAVHVPDMMGLSKVIEDVAAKRIIYVGENHDNYANHAVQLEFIKELHKSGQKLSIGMEMFQRPFQAVLDGFINGEIDQKTFLKKTEYFKRWGFDYELYRPILDYARENRIPVIALNIEKEVVDRVAKEGIDALPPDLKAKVPAEMDFSDDRYKERLKKVFEGHRSVKDLQFDFFYQSQILWDETMAESVDRYLAAHPDFRMIVLAGNGHLMYGSGIPKRTYRRNALGYAIVLNDTDLEKGIADYVVFPKHIEAAKPVRMMVLLEEEKGRVKITGFPEHSISKKAGLEEGDIILSIDDTAISSIDDAKIHLLEKHKGDKIRVRISRGSGKAAKEMQFEITL